MWEAGGGGGRGDGSARQDGGGEKSSKGDCSEKLQMDQDPQLLTFEIFSHIPHFQMDTVFVTDIVMKQGGCAGSGCGKCDCHGVKGQKERSGQRPPAANLSHEVGESSRRDWGGRCGLPLSLPTKPPEDSPAGQYFCPDVKLRGVDGTQRALVTEIFHDPVTRMGAFPPLSQLHLQEAVLQMSDGCWARGMGLVEFLAPSPSHPLTVTRHPREKEASRVYKVSSGFRGCRDPRGRRDHQDKRVTPENQDCQGRKGQEVFLAKMVPRVPQVSQDATGRRVTEGLLGLRVCLDSLEIPGTPVKSSAMYLGPC
ncbi:hypothetical protein CB1_001951012 [Camelus ferus]|nr:hypothetical protein CB1_001951012 [Camelus ferus]